MPQARCHRGTPIDVLNDLGFAGVQNACVDYGQVIVITDKFRYPDTAKLIAVWIENGHWEDIDRPSREAWAQTGRVPRWDGR
jgi:hypothetical protein